MKELTIAYNQDGLILPDMKVMEWAEELAKTFNTGDSSRLSVISGAIMIDAIRLLIVRGVLNHEEVVFKYEDKVTHPDRDGRLKFPHGFCDVGMNIMGEIIETSWERVTGGKPDEPKN